MGNRGTGQLWLHIVPTTIDPVSRKSLLIGVQ